VRCRCRTSRLFDVRWICGKVVHHRQKSKDLLHVEQRQPDIAPRIDSQIRVQRLGGISSLCWHVLCSAWY